jgi:hypothetical protein
MNLAAELAMGVLQIGPGLHIALLTEYLCNGELFGTEYRFAPQKAGVE